MMKAKIIRSIVVALVVILGVILVAVIPCLISLIGHKADTTVITTIGNNGKYILIDSPEKSYYIDLEVTFSTGETVELKDEVKKSLTKVITLDNIVDTEQNNVTITSVMITDMYDGFIPAILIAFFYIGLFVIGCIVVDHHIHKNS